MQFELKPLPYAYDALEPTIDAETMHFHHDKHHQTYVNNLNAAVEGLDLPYTCAGELLKHLDEVPAEKRQGIINNGGGVHNHNVFWESMIPGGAKEPQGKLAEEITKTFGSFEAFKEAFEKAGAGRFGSGWVWLVKEGQELKIVATPTQDSPVSNGQTILLGNDVWEHAYYLKYQNRRADYLKAWWDVVNWDVVAKRYEA